MTAAPDMLQHALDYARRGWLVIPLHTVDDAGACSCLNARCKSQAKHPRTRSGLREASRDEAQIRAWWDRWPRANIGVVTGQRSGLWVLDVDRKGGGLDALGKLRARGIPATLEAQTGSGGRHLLWAWSDGVRNRQRIEIDGEETAIDVRGDGGYIVAPPSLHASGDRYRWGADLYPARAPQWLLDLVLPPVREVVEAPQIQIDALDRETRYAQRVLQTACRSIADAQPGSRHRTILRAVYDAAGLARLMPPDAVQALIQAAQASGKSEREASSVVRETWQAGAQSPRAVPDRRPELGGTRQHVDAEAPLPDEDDVEPVDWSLLESEPGAMDGPPVPPPEAYASEAPAVEKAGPPAPRRERRRIGPRVIQVNARDMREVLADAWAALSELDEADRPYQQDGRVVRILHTATTARVAECTAGAATALLLDSASWVKRRRARKGEATDGEWVLDPADRLPGYLVSAITGRTPRSLPVLETIQHAPYVAPGPRIVSAPGYDEEARSYLQWHGGLDLPDLGDALDLLGEWTGDFPWARESDRAHWFAALLSPIMRRSIAGPVPLTVYEAPSPGTGKSLLMQITARVAAGRHCPPAALASQEEERRKAIVAHLGAGAPVICLDNITGRVDDDVLAGAITAWPRYTDRRMGGQELISVPAATCWAISANNATMSRDIARRMVRVRLDARCAHPEARSGWRHPDLPGWTEREAVHLRAAALSMVQAWIDAGAPAWSGTPLGSFEAWSRAVGGVLEVAGVRGFLADRDETMARADPETAEWAGLALAMLDSPTHGAGGRWRASEIVDVCQARDLLLDTIGEGRRRSASMGRALRAQDGRVYRVGEHEVTITQVGRTGGSTVYGVRTPDGAVLAWRRESV